MSDLGPVRTGAALDVLLDALDEGVAVYDASLRCRACNHRFGEIVELEPAAVVGAPRPDVVHRIASRKGQIDPVFDEISALTVDAAERIFEELELGPENARKVVRWRSRPLPSGPDGPGRVDVLLEVGAGRAAQTKLAELEREMAKAASVDLLTGLPNAKRFVEETDREHRRAQRSWTSYAVAIVDVDDQRAINELHGIRSGDVVLRALGEALRAARREYDVVARGEGDEFVLLLPGADARAARTVVKRIVRGYRDKPLVVGAVKATVSAGASVWTPPSTETASDVISRARASLVAARGKGAASFVIDRGEAGGGVKDGDPEPG